MRRGDFSGRRPPQPPQAPEIKQVPGASRFRPDSADPANSPRSLRVRELGRRLEVARVHADTASGARGDRAALAELLAGVQIGALLVWALDRLSREGIGPLKAETRVPV